MNTLRNNSNLSIVRTIEELKDNRITFYIAYLSLSKLSDVDDKSINIAINIIESLCQQIVNIKIYHYINNDIIILYPSENRKHLENIIFQIRYLFVDDPIAYDRNGNENPDFANIYNPQLDYDNTVYDIKKLIIQMNKITSNSMNDFNLSNIVNTIINLDIKKAVYLNDIYRIDMSSNQAKAIFTECLMNFNYVDAKINSIAQLDEYLVSHIKKHSDVRVLEFLEEYILKNPQKMMSLSLNIDTISTPQFLQFIRSISKTDAKMPIIQVSISNIFSNITTYNKVSALLKSLNCLICIEHLDPETLLYINRKKLNAAFLKIDWNTNYESNSKDIDDLSRAIRRNHPDRIILSNCYQKEAVIFGRNMGLKIFQGSLFDNLVAS